MVKTKTIDTIEIIERINNDGKSVNLDLYMNTMIEIIHEQMANKLEFITLAWSYNRGGGLLVFKESSKKYKYFWRSFDRNKKLELIDLENIHASINIYPLWKNLLYIYRKEVTSNVKSKKKSTKAKA